MTRRILAGDPVAVFNTATMELGNESNATFKLVLVALRETAFPRKSLCVQKRYMRCHNIVVLWLCLHYLVQYAVIQKIISWKSKLLILFSTVSNSPNIGGISFVQPFVGTYFVLRYVFISYSHPQYHITIVIHCT